MLWFLKKFMPRLQDRSVAFISVLFAGSLMMSGCGFKPLYGTPDGASSTENNFSPPVVQALASVDVAGIADRQGQILRNQLVARLGNAAEPQQPLYRLEVRYSERREDFNLRRDNTTSRSRLSLTAQYTLRQGGIILYKGTSRAYASFNILPEQFASTIGERDAQERGLTELAEDIRLQLAAFFYQKYTKAPAAAPTQ